MTSPWGVDQLVIECTVKALLLTSLVQTSTIPMYRVWGSMGTPKGYSGSSEIEPVQREYELALVVDSTSYKRKYSYE